ncbi:MAG TPA: tetratricopeptide repeat protein [Moheibacter sp.]|nr:tetratricopeptide repeat protein [Moheibacter sp.]
MNPRIQHLINHPFETGIDDVALLQNEIEKYPYFSTLRTLLLFGLKESEHESYQEELKKTSICVPSRVALYHYLQKEKQESGSAEKTESVSADTEVENTILETEKIETQSEINEKIEPVLDLREAEDLTHKEFTFSEWLSVSKSEPDPKPAPTEKEIKFQLIDDFIEKSPKISPASKKDENFVPVFKSDQNPEYSDLMTETLARIYMQQKKYDKAIRAYKILKLKYPEKREDFTQKISEIENLKRLP